MVTNQAVAQNKKVDTLYSLQSRNLLQIMKDLIPPPEPLLPKIIAPNEPLRTGGPTPFLDELLINQLDNVDKNRYKLESSIFNEQSLKNLFLQEMRPSDTNPVVFNRYSSAFGNMTYQSSPYFNNMREYNPMTQLISIKELLASDPKSYNPTSQQATVSPYYTPVDKNDKTLIFESRFECGNLALAFKLSENEYNLVLSNDINTRGHTQWFFFRVQNTFKGTSAKFNLLNHSKPDSLFNFGMQVLVYSEEKHKASGIGWHRDGRDIAYFQNNFKKVNIYFDLNSQDSVGRSMYYYTLTFTYDFQSDEDTVFFAYCYPYTYSDLNDELLQLEKDAIKNQYVARNVLCRTLAGNKCEYLTITSKNLPDMKQERKGVVISARQHPGESNGSWMMKGIIDFLVSEAPEAMVLREKFVFKIIPMLNPDGVINGNYRCSLAGADLNRRWKNGTKMLYPEVFETKRLCKNFVKERQVVFYCDLHGHSRNKNIFMYGNNYPENPESTRLFPFIMSKLCDDFSYAGCRFNVHKSKEATARVTMWRELKIPSVFTMEASFCGSDFGKNKGVHYTTEHFLESGRKLCLAMLIYCDVDVPKSLKEIQKQKKKQKVPFILPDESQIAPELAGLNRKALISELMNSKSLLNSGSKGEDDSGEDAGGSDSDPSEDNMEEEEMAKIIPIKIGTSKKKLEPKKQQLSIPKKSFKQQRFINTFIQQHNREESKDQKQQAQQTLKKNSPVKKIVAGGSFFDRVRLPKSFGLRRVEMIDAWTQTSNRGSDTEDNTSPAKDEGTQAQISKESLQFSNKQRVIVSSTKQKAVSLSPTKQDVANIRDRVQAMQIINQYIKETNSSSTSKQGNSNDPYNFLGNQPQQTFFEQRVMKTPVDERKHPHQRQNSNHSIHPIISYNDNQRKLNSIKRGYSEGAGNSSAAQQEDPKPQQINSDSKQYQQQVIARSFQSTQQNDLNNRSFNASNASRQIKQTPNNQGMRASQFGEEHNLKSVQQKRGDSFTRSIFNPQQFGTHANSRATTLPQLTNQSNAPILNSMKTNNSQSLYDSVKPQNSFKLSNQIQNQNNNNLANDDFFNNSYIKGSTSPTIFETSTTSQSRKNYPKSNLSAKDHRPKNDDPQQPQIIPNQSSLDQQSYSTQRKIKLNEEMKQNSVTIVRKRKPSDQASKTFINNNNSSGMFLGSGKRSKAAASYKKSKL